MVWGLACLSRVAGGSRHSPTDGPSFISRGVPAETLAVGAGSVASTTGSVTPATGDASASGSATSCSDTSTTGPGSTAGRVRPNGSVGCSSTSGSPSPGRAAPPEATFTPHRRPLTAPAAAVLTDTPVSKTMATTTTATSTVVAPTPPRAEPSGLPMRAPIQPPAADSWAVALESGGEPPANEASPATANSVRVAPMRARAGSRLTRSPSSLRRPTRSSTPTARVIGGTRNRPHPSRSPRPNRA